MTMTLDEFASSGALGAIRIGADISAARRLLGRAEAMAPIRVSGKRVGTILAYGDLEISHLESKICLIAVELWRPTLTLPAGVERGALKIRARMKKPALLRCLKRAEIPYEEDPDPDWDTAAIRTGPGVTFVFSENRHLDSIQYSGPKRG